MPRRKESRPEQTKPDAEKAAAARIRGAATDRAGFGGQIAYLRKELGRCRSVRRIGMRTLQDRQFEEISAVDWDTQKADLLAMG